MIALSFFLSLSLLGKIHVTFCQIIAFLIWIFFSFITINKKVAFFYILYPKDVAHSFEMKVTNVCFFFLELLFFFSTCTGKNLQFETIIIKIYSFILLAAKVIAVWLWWVLLLFIFFLFHFSFAFLFCKMNDKDDTDITHLCNNISNLSKSSLYSN